MAEIDSSNSSNIPLKHANIIRGPSQLSFDITNKCNFRCLHCYNRSGESQITKNELTDIEILEFIKDIIKLKFLGFCFCGGEPLLREEILYESARLLASSGIIVSLVTNGYVLTADRAKKLSRAGISNTQISLDGVTPETHEHLRKKKGSFNRALNAIKYLAKEGIRPEVGFAPTKFNIHEFLELVVLCRDLKVKEIRVQPLMNLGRAQINEEELIPTPLQYRDLVKMIYELKEKEDGIIITWGDPIDHLIRYRTLMEHCCTFFGIKADGRIQTTPYIPLTVGNVRKHKFSEYWEAGLAKIWQLSILKEMARQIRSIPDFNKRIEGIPRVYFEEDVQLDLIDDNLLGRTKL